MVLSINRNMIFRGYYNFFSFCTFLFHLDQMFTSRFLHTQQNGSHFGGKLGSQFFPTKKHPTFPAKTQGCTPCLATKKQGGGSGLGLTHAALV